MRREMDPGPRERPDEGGKSPLLKVRPDGELSEMATKALTLDCREKLLRRTHSARTRNRHRWTG